MSVRNPFSAMFVLASLAALSGCGAPSSSSEDTQALSSDLIVSVSGCSAGSDTVTVHRGSVGLTYDLRTGTASFAHGGQVKLRDFYAGVAIGGSYVTSSAYAWHSCASTGEQTVITSWGNGHPTMQQFFMLYGGNHLLTRVTVQGSGLASNWMGPVVVDASGSADIGSYGDPRLLWVPFDNDDWIRYNAAPLDSTGTSYEVGAFYDDDSRQGIVVGSVTHDTWKTGVYYEASGGRLQRLNVFGGATWTYGTAMDKNTTHDTMPHGSVTGSTLYSPIVFVGASGDWRNLMEEYADANAWYVPKLPWNGGVPFGWNSWGGFHDKSKGQVLTAQKANDVSNFIAQQLQGHLENGGVAYVNLDANWTNLSDQELAAFVATCRGNGQKAGIYFAPFAAWPWDVGKPVPGTSGQYTYDALFLHDAHGPIMPKPGAYALDPTHPGTQALIDYFVDKFVSLGFEYVKADFLTFGAVEASSHHDPSVQTGIQAYNAGMKHIADRIAGRMFISESIAPLFPYQYAHARRVSCDTYGAPVGLTSSEYELESAAYGWWMNGRLYTFNDPDEVALYDYGGGTPYGAAANKMRVLSAAITGTVLLDGDDLTRPDVQQLALQALSHDRVNAVARLGKAFRPVEGQRGASAPELLVLQDAGVTYLAYFNYGSTPASHSVDLARAGLDGSRTYTVTDLWDGSTHSARGVESVALGGYGSTLLAFQ